MQYNLGVELRALANEYTVAAWEQLYDSLVAKEAKEDILEDVSEIILSLRDIVLVIDGKAD